MSTLMKTTLVVAAAATVVSAEKFNLRSLKKKSGGHDTDDMKKHHRHGGRHHHHHHPMGFEICDTWVDMKDSSDLIYPTGEVPADMLKFCGENNPNCYCKFGHEKSDGGVCKKAEEEGEVNKYECKCLSAEDAAKKIEEIQKKEAERKAELVEHAKMLAHWSFASFGLGAVLFLISLVCLCRQFGRCGGGRCQMRRTRRIDANGILIENVETGAQQEPQNEEHPDDDNLYQPNADVVAPQASAPPQEQVEEVVVAPTSRRNNRCGKINNFAIVRLTLLCLTTVAAFGTGAALFMRSGAELHGRGGHHHHHGDDHKHVHHCGASIVPGNATELYFWGCGHDGLHDCSATEFDCNPFPEHKNMKEE